MKETWCTCNHCGFIHDGVCPRIKSIEYFENGTIKKIEYYGGIDQLTQYNDDPYDVERGANLPF